jgi:hypothetical protein
LLLETGRCGLARCALEFVDVRVACDEPLAQLLVLLVEAAKLYDDLVEKVIDLVLVVSLAEFRRLEPLIDNIFRCQSHRRHLNNFLSCAIKTRLHGPVRNETND